jgi:cellulose biosynthesis protein BcsQ
MQSIAVFNNKGGVGKTTLLCNLAAYLAIAKKRRVLVVDADPQCNATQNLFSDETIEDIYENRTSFTIYSVIRPLSLGRGYSEEIRPRHSAHFHVDIIAGDPRLGLTEDLLANDWSQAIAGDTRGLRTTLLFNQLLSLCTRYDYVIFDMGPSLGSINRAVLIAAAFL